MYTKPLKPPQNHLEATKTDRRFQRWRPESGQYRLNRPRELQQIIVMEHKDQGSIFLTKASYKPSQAH